MSNQLNLIVGVGDPIDHSLSPLLHNAAYKSLGIDAEYLYLNTHVRRGELAPLLKAARKLEWRGVTCMSPHKEDVLTLLDQLDPTAAEIGAVNTVVNNRGELVGYNTDWLGIINALLALTKLSGKSVLVLGAGGSARAALYGLHANEAKLFISNRSGDKGLQLAERFGAHFIPISKLSDAQKFEVIINASSVGSAASQEISLAPASLWRPGVIAVELVYATTQTQFLKDAARGGATIVSGLDILVSQGVPQFEIYTNTKISKESFRLGLAQ